MENLKINYGLFINYHLKMLGFFLIWKIIKLSKSAEFEKR